MGGKILMLLYGWGLTAKNVNHRKFQKNKNLVADNRFFTVFNLLPRVSINMHALYIFNLLPMVSTI